MDNKTWSDFWWKKRGYIHGLWKRKQYTYIKEAALRLPKAAWDEQQEKIDLLQSELEELRKDKARLEWMIENQKFPGFQPKHPLTDGGWYLRFRNLYFQTPREAIDDAMKEGAE